MYWYKRYLAAIAGLLLLCIVSCKRDSGAGGDTMKFFDLKGYFSSEAVRLTKLNPGVNKTAVYNKRRETKKMQITDWNNELAVFSESDINKPSWNKSYTSFTAEGITTFTAVDSSLKTRYIIVKKQGNKVKLILIYNHVENKLFGKSLYQTWENLSYVPDSLYRIDKKQYICVLGFKRYFIKGVPAQ